MAWDGRSATLPPWVPVFAGTETVLAGTAPPAGTPMLIRSATAVAVLSSGQSGQVVFHTAFPHGLVSVAATLDITSGATQLVVALYGLTGFWFVPRSSTGALYAAGTSHRVNYVATGW